MTTQRTLLVLLEKIEQLEKNYTPPHNVSLLTTTESRFLKFDEKEIFKMPKTFRKQFRAQGCTAHIRKRTDGRYNCSYEIRYNKNGYHISASGTTLEVAKARFIEKLNNTTPQEKNYDITIPNNFDKFAVYWFENFHKRKVSEKTYKNNMRIYNRHIKPKFASLALLNMNPAMLQEFIENLPGNGKTADDVHSLLNQVFDTAVKHGKLKLNPLSLFIHKPHERESGVELTLEEELKLLNAYKGTDYEIIFAVMLYTGIRPNELKTAKIAGEFILAVNSKRKNGKVEYKKIPIISYLRTCLKEIETIPCRYEERIRDAFNKVLPSHTLKDLRKTFNTRCVAHKVDYVARKLFMGHSLGKLDNTYTGNLDEYLLSEGKKLESWYSLYPKNTPKNCK